MVVECAAQGGCSAGSASARCSSGCWRPRGTVTAPSSWCTESPASARPRCSSTRSRRARIFASSGLSGVEGEMELDYAALQQLCSPILEFSERLPDPQRDALGVAFGLSAGPPPSPFLVGLAVLGLLSEAAEQQPLLCVVDDAQWLDGASARALAFVARRLLAERIALAFATREVGSGLARFPQLRVEPLGRRDARALLESVLAGAAGRVRARADHRRDRRESARAPGAPARADARASSPAVSACLRRCLCPPGSSRASRGGWRGSRATRGGCCSWRRQTRSATLRFCGAPPSSLGSRRRPRTPWSRRAC